MPQWHFLLFFILVFFQTVLLQSSKSSFSKFLLSRSPCSSFSSKLDLGELSDYCRISSNLVFAKVVVQMTKHKPKRPIIIKVKAFWLSTLPFFISRVPRKTYVKLVTEAPISTYMKTIGIWKISPTKNSKNVISESPSKKLIIWNGAKGLIFIRNSNYWPSVFNEVLMLWISENSFFW